VFGEMPRDQARIGIEPSTRAMTDDDLNGFSLIKVSHRFLVEDSLDGLGRWARCGCPSSQGKENNDKSAA
jgi:hypothetical protein